MGRAYSAGRATSYAGSVPICPSCGAVNPDGFRHCGYCGAALAAPAPERRKLATLVFCDLSGSTALGESTDSEATRNLMLSYFHEMREVLERHGGTVEKFVGDAVLAVFGVPEAHEDDALRGCRSAPGRRPTGAPSPPSRSACGCACAATPASRTRPAAAAAAAPWRASRAS